VGQQDMEMIKKNQNRRSLLGVAVLLIGMGIFYAAPAFAADVVYQNTVSDPTASSTNVAESVMFTSPVSGDVGVVSFTFDEGGNGGPTEEKYILVSIIYQGVNYYFDSGNGCGNSVKVNGGGTRSVQLAGDWVDCTGTGDLLSFQEGQQYGMQMSANTAGFNGQQRFQRSSTTGTGIITATITANDSFTSGNVSLSSGFFATTNTRFTDVSFTGTDATVEYFLDENEIDSSIPERNPSLIRYSYAKQPDTEFSAFSLDIDETTFGTSTNLADFSGLTNGTYDVLIQFSNLGVPFGGPVPFPDSYVYLTIDKSGNNITIEGNVEFYDGTTPLSEDEWQQCGLTELTGCITNAFRFLFVPDPSVLNEVSTVSDQLETTFPFAYLYDFQTVVSSLFGDYSAAVPTFQIAFAGSSITLLSDDLLSNVPFVPFIRTTLGWLLWFGFAWAMYRRTLNIFNQNQTI
jgi:hypothetical protein